VRRFSVIAGIALYARAVAADPAPSADDEVAERLGAERTCAAHQACDWVRTVAPLERATLVRALESEKLELEPDPWGKTINDVHVYVDDPFAEDNWTQVFNVLHFKTVHRALRDELTIGAGQAWNDELVAESARRLHDGLYTSVVVIVPVKSTQPGKIDLLVATRDVFSLRFNSQYTVQQGHLTNLRISISENNFLGNRDLLAASLVMDQGAIYVGPVFIDKNVLGSHLDFRVSADEILTRRSLEVVDPMPPHMTTPSGDPHGIQDGGGLHSEGHDLTVSLARPLWSLATEWGAGVSFGYSDMIRRQFLSTGIAGFDDPNVMSAVPIGREWRQTTSSLDAGAQRQWGEHFKHQVRFGYAFSTTENSTLPGFPADPQLLSDFKSEVLPRNESVSAPYIGYHLYEPVYKTVRDWKTYELAEDSPSFGPNVDFVIAQSLHALGSDYTFTRPTLSVGWTFPWCRDGWISANAGVSMRFQPFTLENGKRVSSIDNSASAGFYVASPRYRYLRVVAQGGIATLWNSSQNQYLSIGGDTALRGYIINQFSGPNGATTNSAQRSINGQIELRSISTEVPHLPWIFDVLHILRLGTVVFYEVGGVSDTMGQIPSSLFHDVGLGVRLLVPPTSRELFRFDLAFPLQATTFGAAFQPHLVLSFSSAF